MILGIGCDDLFVVYDAWTQAQWLAPDAYLVTQASRLEWAVRRAGKAIIITTLTDCAAFLSSLLCPIPNLISFAIFTSLLAAANFALVVTLWPCALMLHLRLCQCCIRHTPRFLSHLVGHLVSHDGAGNERANSVAVVDSSPSPVAAAVSSTVAPSQGTMTESHQSSSAESSGDGKTSAGTGTDAGTASSSRAPSAAAVARRPPRALEHWYEHRFVPWLSRRHVALSLVLITGAASAALAPIFSSMPSTEHDLVLWPSHHFIHRWRQMRQDFFVETERHRLVLLWGTRGVDRQGVRAWNEDVSACYGCERT